MRWKCGERKKYRKKGFRDCRTYYIRKRIRISVTIEDCETISRILEKKLDEKDPIEQAYILEVSSPGIDRPLKKTEHFQKYIGEIIDIKLYKPLEGKKEYQGELKQFEDGIITITDENGKELQFVQKETASVRLAVIFWSII